MNIYIVIIVLLLGGITFLGFQVAHAPDPESATNVAGQEESADTVSAEDSGIAAEEVKVPVSVGKTINLSGTNLSKVPSYVFDARDIAMLDVSNNNLNGSLPAEVRHLQNLQVLDLSDNNFTGVPAEIGQLKNLEVLNLSGNPITGLPLELGNLQSLRVLDLRNTQYSEYDLDIIKTSLPKGVEIKT